MKHKTPLLFAATLCLCTLAGCDKKPAASNVIYISVIDAAEEATMEAFITDYQSIPGNEEKKFEVISMNKDYDNFVYNGMNFSSNVEESIGDIVMVYDYNCEYYANANLDGAGTTLFQSLAPLMQRDGIQESVFVDSVVGITKCKKNSNDMYWIPRDYNKVVCAFNKKIFDILKNADSSISYPQDNWTWTQFVELCNKLVALKNNTALQEYIGGRGDEDFWAIDMNLRFPAVYYPILKSFGTNLIDVANKKVFGNSTEDVNKAKTAWGTLLSMVDNKLAYESNDDIHPFTSKQTAMAFIVRPDLPSYVAELGTDAIDFVTIPTYDTTDFPSGGTSYIGMGCTGYALSTACPDDKKDAAWDFMKYMISVRGQNHFSSIGSGIPCLKSLIEDSNAEFRKYCSSSLNHNAFVSHAERDLAVNWLKGLEVSNKPNKRNYLSIITYVQANALTSFYKASKRESMFTTFKNALEGSGYLGDLS